MRRGRSHSGSVSNFLWLENFPSCSGLSRGAPELLSLNWLSLNWKCFVFWPRRVRTRRLGSWFAPSCQECRGGCTAPRMCDISALLWEQIKSRCQRLNLTTPGSRYRHLPLRPTDVSLCRRLAPGDISARGRGAHRACPHSQYLEPQGQPLLCSQASGQRLRHGLT